MSTVYEFSISPLNMFSSPFEAYRQTDEHDVCLQYIPYGDTKFGSIEIFEETSSLSAVEYKELKKQKESFVKEKAFLNITLFFFQFLKLVLQFQSFALI